MHHGPRMRVMLSGAQSKHLARNCVWAWFVAGFLRSASLRSKRQKGGAPDEMTIQRDTLVEMAEENRMPSLRESKCL